MKPEQIFEHEPVSQESEEKPGDNIVPYTEEYKDRVEKFYAVLRDESKKGEITDSPDMETIPENFWVATNEADEVIGTVGLDYAGNDIGYVKKMFVQTQMRGRGIGERLLGSSVECAKQKGYKKIFLAAMPKNTRAQKFYKKNGFKKAGKPATDTIIFNEGAVFFEMELE